MIHDALIGIAMVVFLALGSMTPQAAPPDVGMSVTNQRGVGLIPPQAALGTALTGGNLSYADTKYGPDYLAVRYPRGTTVRVCAVTCQTLRSTDYGPDPRIRPPRIADLAFVRFMAVCGYTAKEARLRGICEATIEVGGLSLPRTDAEPGYVP